MMRLSLLIWSVAVSAVAQVSISDKPLVENHRKAVWDKTGPTPITVHFSSRIAGRWRFCHNGKEVTVAPWEASGETGSIYEIVECESLAHCLKVIEAKGLKIPKQVQDEIDRLQGKEPELTNDR